jgi:hypothetical protein
MVRYCFPDVALVSTEFTQILQREHYVPKIATVCVNCGTAFERHASFHKIAEARGGTVKFCSRACTDAGRSKGLLGTKKRRGQNLVCEICQSPFYRKASMVKAGKSRFCSEPCRLKAHELKRVDRTAPRPQNLRGSMITCIFCGKSIYRKKSMLARNIGKTCGDQACISAYGRQLWGLSPRDQGTVRLPRAQRKYRLANFTAKQRAEWIGSTCARCGTTENLTLDHIVAVCCGGPATKSNSQTLCGPCNNWKAKHIDRPMARKQLLSGG